MAAPSPPSPLARECTNTWTPNCTHHQIVDPSNCRIVNSCPGVTTPTRALACEASATHHGQSPWPETPDYSSSRPRCNTQSRTTASWSLPDHKTRHHMPVMHKSQLNGCSQALSMHEPLMWMSTCVQNQSQGPDLNNYGGIIVHKAKSAATHMPSVEM